mgnify:FL=1
MHFISSAMASFCLETTVEDAMQTVRDAGFDSLDFPLSVYSRPQDAPLRVPLSDLVPDADYTFTIALKSGEKLEGETKVAYHSPAVTDKYTDHGMGNTYRTSKLQTDFIGF